MRRLLLMLPMCDAAVDAEFDAACCDAVIAAAVDDANAAECDGACVADAVDADVDDVLVFWLLLSVAAAGCC